MKGVADAVMLRELLSDHLGGLAVTGDNSSAKVGAAEAMREIDREGLEPLQAMGRLPRNLKRYRGDVDYSTITKAVPAVMQKHGVGAEILDEIHDPR